MSHILLNFISITLLVHCCQSSLPSSSTTFCATCQQYIHTLSPIVRKGQFTTVNYCMPANACYYRGFFMRTYSRNVRRAWDGDDYRVPKRQRLDDPKNASLQTTNENLPLEDNLQRAIRETSVAAMSSSPSRRNSTIFSFNELQEPRHHHQLTPPSSPPPMLEITPPVIKARKPTFSTLEKKRLKNAKGRGKMKMYAMRPNLFPKS